MGVDLGKNNLSIYFFRHIEYIDIFLLIYQTHRYIPGAIYRLIDILIYLIRFAILVLGTTINSPMYSQTLQKLKNQVR